MSDRRNGRGNQRNNIRKNDRQRDAVKRAAQSLARRKQNQARKAKLFWFLSFVCIIILVVTALLLSFLLSYFANRSKSVSASNVSETESEAESVPETHDQVTAPVNNSDETENNTLPIDKGNSVVHQFTKSPDAVSLSSLRSDYGILVDLSDNTIVGYKNTNTRVYPASLTKVMTLITAYDAIGDINTEKFTMTYDILNPLITSGNSLAGFEVGETAAIRDYMYGMILPSGADAAEAIAVYCAGSIEKFADMMNTKATQLGLTDSHFTNPVGEYNKNNYSTVYDLAVILDYAYQYPALAEILNMYKYTTAATNMHPDGIYLESNLQQRMVGDESGTCMVSGGKTGYTSEAGHCVMCYATSNSTGKRYIFVSAKGKAMYDPINDCIDTLKKYVK